MRTSELVFDGPVWAHTSPVYVTVAGHRIASRQDAEYFVDWIEQMLRVVDARNRFASIEDVLSAGVEALQQRDEADQEWLVYARGEAESGFAALDRDEGIRGTADEHMARIDAAIRAADRAGE